MTARWILASERWALTKFRASSEIWSPIIRPIREASMNSSGFVKSEFRSGPFAPWRMLSTALLALCLSMPAATSARQELAIAEERVYTGTVWQCDRRTAESVRAWGWTS